MNQYVIDALWNAAQLALDAKDIEGIKSVIAQIESNGSLPDDPTQPVLWYASNNTAKKICALLEKQQCFERFMEKPDINPADFTTRQFREFLEAEGQIKTMKTVVEECKHRVGHVMEQYSNPKSEYYKNITRLKTRGHYTKNQNYLGIPLVH